MMDHVAKGPVVLIASSNGGQICGYIARTRPEQVKGLILIGFEIPHQFFALNQRLITLFILGPSIRNKYHDWIKARKEGIIPQEMLENYDKGEKIKHKTAYGDSYFWKESHERSIEFETDLEKPIEVK